MQRVNEGYGEVSSIVPKLTLAAIQAIVLISVFQFIRIILFRDLATWKVNMVIVLGSLVATMASFLLLYKYQTLLKESALQKSSLERLVNERTLELRQANREMSLEIGERERMQQALVENERRFRTIIHEAAIGMAVIDKQGRLMQSNRALQRMLDYNSEKLEDMVIAQITYPDDVVAA